MIRLEGVKKTYKKAASPALDGISLEVAAGEFAFLIGPSGSGKSTLLGLLLREQKVDEGLIEVAGVDLSNLSARKTAHFRRRLGVVFQDFQLLPGKTAGENVAFALEVTGTPPALVRTRTQEALERVGLGEKGNRRIDQLSGGEAQRVAVARALVNNPVLLLADEPTGNLDPATSAGIMDLLGEINASGTTILMATHDVGIVNTMQRRVIALSDGVVVRDQVGGSYTEAEVL
jgi:cell division transport system ATP-binding protein